MQNSKAKIALFLGGLSILMLVFYFTKPSSNSKNRLDSANSNRSGVVSASRNNATTVRENPSATSPGQPIGSGGKASLAGELKKSAEMYKNFIKEDARKSAPAYNAFAKKNLEILKKRKRS
jgi:hypothetical protein